MPREAGAGGGMPAAPTPPNDDTEELRRPDATAAALERLEVGAAERLRAAAPKAAPLPRDDAVAERRAPEAAALVRRLDFGAAPGAAPSCALTAGSASAASERGSGDSSLTGAAASGAGTKPRTASDASVRRMTTAVTLGCAGTSAAAPGSAVPASARSSSAARVSVSPPCTAPRLSGKSPGGKKSSRGVRACPSAARLCS